MRKKPQFISIIIAVILALLTVLVGLLSSVASNNIPPLVTPYLRYTWPVLGAATLVLVVLTVWQIVRQSAGEDNTVLSKSEHYQQSIEKQNRQRMLARVHAIWIKGLLEHSLYNEVLIALGLTERKDVIANPWHLVIPQPDHTEHPLPPGTRITEVYDDANGELLILGEPGSGKTTLLLELACDLLERAKKDETHPIPAVFNLSSWAVKHQPISDWLVEELNTKYQVSRKLAQSWINDDQILLLLDGLDEVDQKYREACMGAINDYHKEHMVPMVICSRSSEYLVQSNRLTLRSAIMVQNLTVQQIEDYLWHAGSQLEAIRVALHDDPDLLKLAETPLMLNVLTLAYHEVPVEDLMVKSSSDSQRKQVFSTYVHHMLHRRGTETHYTQQQTISQLAWLARQMAQHSQTQFYIERIQRDWLTKSRSHPIIYVSVTRLLTGLVYGLIIGLVCGLFIGLLSVFNFGLANVLSLGLAGFIIGLGFGMILGLFSGIEKEIKPAEMIIWSWKSMRQNLVKNLRKGLTVGLTVGLLLIIAIIVNVLFVRPTLIPNTTLDYRLSLGLTVGTVFGLAFGIVFGLAFGLGFGLIGGFSSEMLSETELTKPNRGIWLSARNSILFGLLGGVIFEAAGRLIFELQIRHVFIFYGGTAQLSSFQTVFIFMLVGILGLGLPNGGRACIEHLALRLLLWRARHIPLNYPRFLDYAVEHILLRKVGGGYIFIHRLLQDYFASLETEPIPNKVADQAQDSTSAP